MRARIMVGLLLAAALVLAVASGALGAGEPARDQEQLQSQQRFRVHERLQLQARELKQAQLRLREGVEVALPPDGAVTSDQALQIQGQVQAEYQVQVRLVTAAGEQMLQAMVGQDGSFTSPDLPLQPGLNQIRLQVRDQNGLMVAEAVRRIVRPGGELPPLPDVAGHWAEDAIVRMAALQVVSGYEDGSFHAADKVTGAQFVKMLAATAGLPEATEPTEGYEGIPAGNWANGYLGAAVRAGIVKGPEDPAFPGNGQATRAQMTVMLIRALGLEEEARQVAAESQLRTQFGDSEAIPEWARAAVALAYEKGLVSGLPDGTFRPDDPADRAQAVVLLLRFLDLYQTEAAVQP